MKLGYSGLPKWLLRRVGAGSNFSSRSKFLGGSVMRTLLRSFRILSAFFLVSFCVSNHVAAQSTYTAQLTGVISDSSGAVIPGAKVTLTDEGTNIAANNVTNGSGIYLFTNVRPGTYTIRVESSGLTPQERKGLTLAVC